jgi:putative flavoprotein involved in K+ transport
MRRGGDGLRRLVFGNLSEYGLPRSPRGIKSNVIERGMGPAFDDGNFVSALKSRRIEIVGAVDVMDGRYVELADGARLAPEVVIAATGYRRNLERLIGDLGVLGEDGRPLVTGRETLPHAPGLYFIGFMAGVAGPLAAMGPDAKQIARAAKKELVRRRSGGKDQIRLRRSSASHRPLAR